MAHSEFVSLAIITLASCIVIFFRTAQGQGVPVVASTPLLPGGSSPQPFLTAAVPPQSSQPLLFYPPLNQQSFPSYGQPAQFLMDGGNSGAGWGQPISAYYMPCPTEDPEYGSNLLMGLERNFGTYFEPIIAGIRRSYGNFFPFGGGTTEKWHVDSYQPSPYLAPTEYSAMLPRQLLVGGGRYPPGIGASQPFPSYYNYSYNYPQRMMMVPVPIGSGNGYYYPYPTQPDYYYHSESIGRRRLSSLDTSPQSCAIDSKSDECKKSLLNIQDMVSSVSGNSSLDTTTGGSPEERSAADNLYMLLASTLYPSALASHLTLSAAESINDVLGEVTVTPLKLTQHLSNSQDRLEKLIKGATTTTTDGAGGSTPPDSSKANNNANGFLRKNHANENGVMASN